MSLKSVLCLAVASAAFPQAGLAQSSGQGLTALPSYAQPGQCYARVRHNAKFATQDQIVVVQEGYQTIEVDQPQIATRTEQVMVKEPSVRYEVRQPQYRTVSEQVMVRPAYDKLRVTPPSFSTVTEIVQVSAPRTVWKRGNPGKLAAQGYKILSTAGGGYSASGSQSYSGYSGSKNVQRQFCDNDCEIWCLVEEPAETVSYNKKVVSSPSRVVREPVAAKYQTITKKVLSDPGGVREIPVPAEYATITTEEIVSLGGERYVDVPPVTGTVQKKTLIEEERYEWMRVVCASGQIMPDGGRTSGHSTTTYGSGGYSSGGYSSGSSYSSGSYSSGSTTYSTGTYGSGSSYSSQSSGYSHSGSGNMTGRTYSDGTVFGHGSSTSDSGIVYGGERREPYRRRD